MKTSWVKKPFCIMWMKDYMDYLTAYSVIMHMWSPFCRRGPNKMGSIILSAYGTNMWWPWLHSTVLWLARTHEGDGMLFENMGSYNVAAASSFNGFQGTDHLLCDIRADKVSDTVSPEPRLSTWGGRAGHQYSACVLCLGEWDEGPLTSLWVNS